MQTSNLAHSVKLLYCENLLGGEYFLA